MDGAGADHIGGFLGGAEVLAEGTDLEVHGDFDGGIELDDGCDLKLDADVATLERGAGLAVAVNDFGRAQRHLVADMENGGLAVDGADARAGKCAGVHVLFEEPKRRGGQRQRAASEGRVERVELQDVADQQRAGCDRELRAKVDAELFGFGAVDLKHFDFEHHLCRAAVIDADQPVGQSHFVGCGPHGDGVLRRVYRDGVEPQRCGQRVGDGLGAAGIHEEGAHEIVGIFVALCGNVIGDDHRVRPHAAIEGAVGFQEQFKSLLEGDFLGKDGHVAVAEVAVKDHIHAIGAAKGEDGFFERGILKIDRDECAGVQTDGINRTFGQGAVVEFTQEVERRAIFRIKGQRVFGHANGAFGAPEIGSNTGISIGGTCFLGV